MECATHMGIYSAMLFRYGRMALYLAMTCISMNSIKDALACGHREGDIDFYAIDTDFRGLAQKFEISVGSVAAPRTAMGASVIHRGLFCDVHEV